MTKPFSLSLRLGLSIGFLGSALVIVILAQSWLTLRSQLERLADSRLEQKLEQLTHTIKEASPVSLSSLDSHPLVDLVTGHPDLGLLVCDARHPRKTLFSIGNVPDKVSSDGSCYKSGTQSHSGLDMRTQATTFNVGPNGDRLSLVLMGSRTDDSKLLDEFLNSTLLILPIFLMIIGVGAWWIARRGLAPLDRFQKLAAIVSTHDMKGRILSSGLPRELGDLASSINVMLDRLENGVQQLSDFSDDLAHELRSPITNLMGKAQVALSRNRTSLHYREALESCVEELGRLSRIVSDMLYLAQTVQVESSELADNISLNSEAQHVADLFSIVAEEKGVGLVVQGEGLVQGNRLMVQRAISNLLSNAIRHASPDTTIPIVIAIEGRSVVLSVTNHGPGFPQEQAEAIFNRFYRIGGGRSRNEGGTGLGLSIVRLIMKNHRGRVTALSSEKGPTTFKLLFNSN